MSSRIIRTPEVLFYEVEVYSYTTTDSVYIEIQDPSAGELTLELDGDEVQPFVDAILEVQAQRQPDEPDVEPTPVISPLVARSQVTAFINAKVPMVIDYEDAEGTRSRRTVSAYQIKGDADLYVVGWSHEREGIRNFTLRNIRGIAPSPAEFRPEQG